ncbi:MAG: isoprenylcysteine carboxylmethyltransferase family protein [Anaerolineales bacterium]|nr:isoprenylcysteine carboxylmethyltransferase family protein [Anaerolineales bacterium]
MGSRKMNVYGVVLTIAAVGQIILAFLLYNPEGNTAVINAGWGVLMLSAIFGWLPIYTFRKKGRVQGKSYINTTKLVDSGIYAIVRHPQYLAGVLICIALPLISQHWLVAVPGIVAAVIYYMDTYEEEKGCIIKFGDEYRQYMQRVPRMNFILGIIRKIR